MSTNTPNYNLEKPGTEEFYDVNVPNGNMDKIDTALKTLAEEVASGVTQEDLTAIDTKLDGINQGVGEVKGKSDQIKQGVDNLNTKQDSLLLKIQNGALKQNIAIFDKPGTYTWKCPDGVTAVVLTMFGGGGSGSVKVVNSGYGGANGGYGGASVREKPVKVTPGTTYSLVVGTGGARLLNVSTTTSGNTGGTTSAFGITCNGGYGGSVGDGSLAKGNSPLCNKGTGNNNYTSSAYVVETYSTTTYGLPGRNTSYSSNYVYGGGAGFGDGGDAMDLNTPVAPGAGSGGGSGLDSGSSAKGGDGIIIIQY